MYIYISRPGKGSRVISRSRVSSDRNAAEVVLVRVAELGVEMHARIHIYICIKWPRSIYQPQTSAHVSRMLYNSAMYIIYIIMCNGV